MHTIPSAARSMSSAYGALRSQSDPQRCRWNVALGGCPRLGRATAQLCTFLVFAGPETDGSRHSSSTSAVVLATALVLLLWLASRAKLRSHGWSWRTLPTRRM